MEKDETWKQISLISELHLQFLEKHKAHPKLIDIRCLGTILAIELKTPEHTHYLNNASENIAKFFLDNNIIVRPLGNILYFIPPYCITQKELENVYLVTELFLKGWN